jgi:hypothetical protein
MAEITLFSSLYSAWRMVDITPQVINCVQIMPALSEISKSALKNKSFETLSMRA